MDPRLIDRCRHCEAPITTLRNGVCQNCPRREGDLRRGMLAGHTLALRGVRQLVVGNPDWFVTGEIAASFVRALEIAHHRTKTDLEEEQLPSAVLECILELETSR